jgi:hypothetical protein
MPTAIFSAEVAIEECLAQRGLKHHPGDYQPGHNSDGPEDYAVNDPFRHGHRQPFFGLPELSLFLVNGRLSRTTELLTNSLKCPVISDG